MRYTHILICDQCGHRRTDFPSLTTDKGNYRIVRCPRCNWSGYIYRIDREEPVKASLKKRKKG